MSRELKFKLLDVKNNKFWVDGKGWDLYSLFVAYREQIADTKNYQLIQFTGLLDKNSKEIYEGDIVKIGGEEILSWGQEVFLVEHEDYYFKPFNHYCSKNCQVIGNIFQNPELLKKS